MFVGLGSLSRGQSLLTIRLISYQGEVLWLLQPQLPCMYNSCFDFPWPLVVHGFAADFEHLVIVPFRLCKTRHAVGPRVEVSIVSTVVWSMQARTSRPRTSATAHEVAIGILTLGFRDYRVTPVLRLRVYRRSSNRMMGLTPGPPGFAYQRNSLCTTAELRSPSLA